MPSRINQSLVREGRENGLWLGRLFRRVLSTPLKGTDARFPVHHTVPDSFSPSGSPSPLFIFHTDCLLLLIYSFFLKILFSQENIFIHIIERQKHQHERETSISSPQHVPQLGIKPTAFWCIGQCCNYLSQSHLVRAIYSFLSGLMPLTWLQSTSLQISVSIT